MIARNKENNSAGANNKERFLHPKFWPVWALIGLMKLLARLSTKRQVQVGRLLGRLAYKIMKKRRDIIRINLELCFPELSPDEREQLAKDCMEENAIGFIETARAWFGDPETLRQQLQIDGLDHLQAALDQGKGVLVIGGHYTTLDLGSVMASLYVDFYCLYRANNNPLLNHVMTHSRAKAATPVDKRDMRTVIRLLKRGEALWYAPDQDYGGHASVFAPFFGVPAATITATTKIASINRSPVLIIGYRRKRDDSGYELSFSPALDNFPSGDEEKDATLINARLEQEIRKAPAQYMWLHRRFKTRPEGMPKVY